jgi:hypothetical protein
MRGARLRYKHLTLDVRATSQRRHVVSDAAKRDTATAVGHERSSGQSGDGAMAKRRRSTSDAAQQSGFDAVLICSCGHGIDRHDSLGCRRCLFDQNVSEVCALAQTDIIEVEDNQDRLKPLK